MAAEADIKIKKKEVLAHEEEHIEKGEEGPFLSWLIPAAIGLFASSKQSSAAKSATAAQVQEGEREIEFARESRDLARGDVAPYREAGYTALDALMSMTGLKVLAAVAVGLVNPHIPAQALQLPLGLTLLGVPR